MELGRHASAPLLHTKSCDRLGVVGSCTEYIKSSSGSNSKDLCSRVLGCMGDGGPISSDTVFKKSWILDPRRLDPSGRGITENPKSCRMLFSPSQAMK